MDRDNPNSGRTMPPVSIGRNIIAARTRRGWRKASELAADLKLPASTISRWESDAVVPDLGSLLRIAVATQTTLSALIVGHDPAYDQMSSGAEEYLVQLTELVPQLTPQQQWVVTNLARALLDLPPLAPPRAHATP